MERKLRILLVLLLFLTSFPVNAQKEEVDSLLKQAYIQLTGAKWFDAEITLLKILDIKSYASKEKLYGAYNNLGVINKELGKFNTALEYFDEAEKCLEGKESELLAAIFANKGMILNTLKQYDASNNYLEKAIRMFKSIKPESTYGLQAFSAAYLNYGLNLLEINQPREALIYLEQSYDIKTQYGLPGLQLVYVNLAKAYEGINDYSRAGEWYKKSIDMVIREYGEYYHRLPETYFVYARFLRKNNINEEALEILRKAIRICIRNYGNKHTLVSMALKETGDHFMETSEIDSALVYYQKSLIAVVPDYNNYDYMDNPAIDTSLYNNRLLEDLKKKSLALEKLADLRNNVDDKKSLLTKSIETNNLAILLIDRIRREYPTDDDRLYLIQNERNTYSDAIRQVNKLYDITSDLELIPAIYDIARKAKAAVLLDAITGNDIFLKLSVPDSLNNKISDLTSAISIYEKQIREQSGNDDLDSKQINEWKDELFSLNQELEKTRNEINYQFPDYRNLLYKAKPKPLSEIQAQLGKDETIIDYYIDNQYLNEQRMLFAFVITRESIQMNKTLIGPGFSDNIEILRKFYSPVLINSSEAGIISESLYSLYSVLIEPIENMLAGDRMIVIPDDEIYLIPFDALIDKRPDKGSPSFDGLSYLLKKYIISYGYSSSLVKSAVKAGLSGKVIAFAPDYSESGGDLIELSGASNEISQILEIFNGSMFYRGIATKQNFRKALDRTDILHLAMHSVMDSANSKYSFLLFDDPLDGTGDNRMYNYEIGLLRINSPMVVLSTCNSGTGTLYHGEGVMSLARGFIIAGASSVVRTSWEVNDEISSRIITSFYKNLSKGMAKDESMREAKLEYLESSPPMMKNPYYWAAYEILGDNSPVKISRVRLFTITAAIVVVFLFLGYVYFKRRSIFSERVL